MSLRRGFSLVELVIALLLTGIIGVALSRLVISQARFVAGQDGMLQSRSGVRAALNLVTGELRALTTGGLLAASTDSITVRVPYAFGVSCYPFNYGSFVSLLPGDSSIVNGAVPSGYAFRDSTGTWKFPATATVYSFNYNALGICTWLTPPVTTLAAPNWAARDIAVTTSDASGVPPVGNLMYVYQKVTYVLGPSASLPGRKALWRRVAGGTSDELVVPFDTGSGFKFLVGSRLTPRSTPPALLDSVVGVRLRLVGQSEKAPEGKSAPSRFDVTTNILFRNNRGY